VFDLSIFLWTLAVLLAAATVTWGVSLARHNVAIVDSLWSLMFLAAALTCVVRLPFAGGGLPPRTMLLLVLVAIWSLRLATYITVRNWGHEEDRRYQAIRARNNPGFEVKSLYLVFWLQAVLAWIIALPLHGAIVGSAVAAARVGGAPTAPLGPLDFAGAALWLVGIAFEAGGDWQLARFKADPANKGKVMDRGFWRLTRHPNYFGDFAIWWGFYLIALSAGAWWSFVGPLVMSFMLMRVSGVTLLEKDIGERRPGYAEYVRRTNAFFPGPPRK
jgi:steroid 5-alpha reductase family enzyme